MVTFIRGLPGSGKSTFGKSLNCFHIEADMYHIMNGGYIFDKDQLSEAHEWCYDMFTQSCKLMDVVVSNTFTRYSELKPYIDYCKFYRIPFKIIRMETNYKSIHNVPNEVIDGMRERFEDIEGEEIIK